MGWWDTTMNFLGQGGLAGTWGSGGSGGSGGVGAPPQPISTRYAGGVPSFPEPNLTAGIYDAPSSPLLPRGSELNPEPFSWDAWAGQQVGEFAPEVRAMTEQPGFGAYPTRGAGGGNNWGQYANALGTISDSFTPVNQAETVLGPLAGRPGVTRHVNPLSGLGAAPTSVWRGRR